MIGLGSQKSATSVIRAQVIRSLWLRTVAYAAIGRSHDAGRRAVPACPA
jgi:hypothetical protein